MKRALVVGIDAYPKHPLTGCVNDAVALGTVLDTLGNGDPNFSVVTLTSQVQKVTAQALHPAVAMLFPASAATAPPSFARHGNTNPATHPRHLLPPHPPPAPPPLPP